LRRHEIYVFVDKLREQIYERVEKRFAVELEDVHVYSNDERTRCFYSLNVSSIGKNEVLELISATDNALASLDQPQYYEDPTPHVSFAWELGDAIDVASSILAQNDDEKQKDSARGEKSKGQLRDNNVNEKLRVPCKVLSTKPVNEMSSKQQDHENISFMVDRIVCKSGNKVFMLPLR